MADAPEKSAPQLFTEFEGQLKARKQALVGSLRDIAL
jgi:hypothetical protein